MAPWEELPYFQAPKDTNLSIGASAVPLCKSDPMRVVLGLFIHTGAATVCVGLDSSITTTKGISLTVNFPMWLTAKDHPSLVQHEWWGISTGAGLTIDVFEVFMSKWPDTDVSLAVNKAREAHASEPTIGDGGRD